MYIFYVYVFYIKHHNIILWKFVINVTMKFYLSSVITFKRLGNAWYSRHETFNYAKNICRTHNSFRTSIWDKGSERPKQPLKNNEYYRALQHNMGFN